MCLVVTNFGEMLFFVGYDQYRTRAKTNVKFKADLNNSAKILELCFHSFVIYNEAFREIRMK